MDYTLSKKTMSLSETVFEGSLEQPIDLDFTLPDYCPDIQKILKCQVYPKVYTRNISGDRLEIDGASTVKVLYVDSLRNAVRTSEHTIPFSCSFNLKTLPQNALILTSTKPEYINCRALTPRRLDIHGAFTMCAKVVCKIEKEIFYGVENEDAQVNSKSLQVSAVTGFSQHFFTISQDIEISENDKQLETLLRSDVKTIVRECKTITNKMMLKCDVNLNILYLSDIDNGTTDVLDYTLPINQIIDVEQAEEISQTSLTLDILNYDIRIRNDLSENTIITLEAKLCATALMHEDEEISVLTDAYSTIYDLDLIYNQLSLTKIHSIISDSCIAKETLEISSNSINKILDLWCEQATCKTMIENSQMILNGKVNICILACDSENVPFYTERTIDFTYPLSSITQIQNLTALGSAFATSISYRLNGSNNIDVRAEIKLDIIVQENISIRCINSVSADEEHLRKKDDTVALTLYYADDNEKIWDIARDYCVCCDNIKKENELIDDIIIGDKMILIPYI